MVILIGQQCKVVERIAPIVGNQLLNRLPVSRGLDSSGQDRFEKKKHRKQTEKDRRFTDCAKHRLCSRAGGIESVGAL